MHVWCVFHDVAYESKDLEAIFSTWEAAVAEATRLAKESQERSHWDLEEVIYERAPEEFRYSEYSIVFGKARETQAFVVETFEVQ